MSQGNDARSLGLSRDKEPGRGAVSGVMARAGGLAQERVVKGSHIVAAQAWVDARLGAGTFASLMQPAGEAWKIILPVAWYDIDTLVVALGTVASRLGLSVEDITTEIAKKNAENDLRSLYKVFLRVAQPQLVLSQTPRLWSTYVKFGKAAALVNEKGHYIGQGDGFDDRLLGWGCGCWRGFIPATIQVAGGRIQDAQIVRTWRQYDGSYSVEFEVYYL